MSTFLETLRLECAFRVRLRVVRGYGFGAIARGGGEWKGGGEVVSKGEGVVVLFGVCVVTRWRCYGQGCRVRAE